VPFDFDKLYPNVWLGATICNQTEADRDIPKLVQIQARVRFLSIEPMLGSIDLRKWLNPWTCADCNFHGSEHDAGPDGCEKCGDEVAFPAGSGVCKGCGADDQSARPSCPFCGNHRSFERDHGYMFDSGRNLLDWIIAGGESGPGARPMHPEWVRSLAKQCQEAAVPFLMKQWGEWLPVAQMDDEFMNRLYKPIRVARRHENQGALDDSYGRRCIVPQAVQQADGTVLEAMSPMVFQQGRGSMLTFKVGKKVAGRLLDGVEFNEFPTVVRIGATTSN
jgi:protein gp37